MQNRTRIDTFAHTRTRTRTRTHSLTHAHVHALALAFALAFALARMRTCTRILSIGQMGPYWYSKGTPLNRMGVTTRRHDTLALRGGFVALQVNNVL